MIEETSENFYDFDIIICDRFFEFTKGLDVDVIVDEILKYKECTNGTHEAYYTPYNISFSNQEELYKLPTILN